MTDFDTLRDRVEATTQKLKSTQADRQNQTESLVTILRELEEKHEAQAQQLVYYKNRLAPLEQANHQLAALMENLLDLIDSGFGDESLVPLRDASDMAAAMLSSDLFMPGQEAATAPTEDLSEAAADTSDEEMPEPERVAAEADEEPEAAEASEDFADADEQPVAEAAEESEAVAEMAEAEDDLEMEEDALISLDELLDLASEESPEETVAFEDADQYGSAAVAEVEPEPVEAVAEFAEDVEAVADDAIIDDGGFEADVFGEGTDLVEASFEDVSDAALALEVDEDAAAGTDDLPQVVKDAMAAASEDDGAIDLVPEIPSMADDEETAAVAEADDLETIAALAQQIEEETAAEGAPPPAQSDIRALLMRVEKLAKKAEAMRLAQGVPAESQAVPKAKPEKPARRAGAAA